MLCLSLFPLFYVYFSLVAVALDTPNSSSIRQEKKQCVKEKKSNESKQHRKNKKETDHKGKALTGTRGERNKERETTELTETRNSSLLVTK